MKRTDETRAKHVWRFFRAGGFDQVRLDTGREIAALGQLDQKLWVALACPTRGIEFDAATLDLIDADRDGRIRAPDLIAAVDWTVGLLKDPEVLIKGRQTLALDELSDTPDGKRLLASARTILGMLGRGDDAEISLDDAASIETIYDGSAFNGDGIVPPEAAEDDATRATLADIVACMGAETDRSGRPGASQATSDRFFAEATSYAAWRAEATTRAGELLPLGERTETLAESLSALTDKLDDYFTRCRLARFDPRAGDALNPPLAAYEALAAASVDSDTSELRVLPLARIEAGRALPLEDGINPAWAATVARFRRDIVAPLLGERTTLSEGDWETIKARFAPYRDWLARKPATALEPLGIARIQALADPAAKAQVDALIARDRALEPEMNAISDVEKLIRFQRDLAPLLNNVVSFRDFYTRNGKAMFQAGTLYLDARSCELCVRVEDETKHAQLATLSRVYLAYCQCTRGADKMTIAAAFTAGDADNLRVGRNGVFYDRKGRDWDASIVKIVEHPISLAQAFFLPYKQAARMLAEQAQKLAAARQAASQAQAQTQLMARSVAAASGAPAAPAAAAPTAPAAAATAPAAGAPGAPQAFDAARFAGIFAAIGLAIGAIGTAVASIVTGFLHLAWWQMPLAVLGVILVISGPSMLIAALKLRSRNLGPILDASGWAVNTRLKVNIPFGTALTSVAHLPAGAQRALTDPYAEKPTPWRLYLAIVIVVVVVAALWWSGLAAMAIHLLAQHL